MEIHIENEDGLGFFRGFFWAMFGSLIIYAAFYSCYLYGFKKGVEAEEMKMFHANQKLQNANRIISGVSE